MNERDPFFLLTLSALKTPPQSFPPPAVPPPAPETDEDQLVERLRDALRRLGYEVT